MVDEDGPCSLVPKGPRRVGRKRRWTDDVLELWTEESDCGMRGEVGRWTDNKPLPREDPSFLDRDELGVGCCCCCGGCSGIEWAVTGVLGLERLVSPRELLLPPLDLRDAPRVRPKRLCRRLRVPLDV